MNARLVEASFACRLCAGTIGVWLAQRGVPSPGPAPPAPFAGPQISTDYARIGIDAGPLSVTIGGEVVEHALHMIVPALEEPDAPGLYWADPEFAPFWCPECAESYCGDHWRTWLVFDDEDPGWLEEQRGVCPNGHERMLQD